MTTTVKSGVGAREEIVRLWCGGPAGTVGAARARGGRGKAGRGLWPLRVSGGGEAPLREGEKKDKEKKKEKKRDKEKKREKNASRVKDDKEAWRQSVRVEPRYVGGNSADERRASASASSGTSAPEKEAAGPPAAEKKDDAAEGGFKTGSLDLSIERVVDDPCPKDGPPEPGDIHIEVHTRGKWDDLKKVMRPTQTALGWDWTFRKLKNFMTAEEAQAYMNVKPVPYVQRGKYKYILDHHHTLCALEMSGFHGTEVVLARVMEEDSKTRSREAFFGYLEGRGWAYLRDKNYERVNYRDLPEVWDISNFRNDVYRSLGGFMRVHKVLKRGVDLQSKLFFEFRWGYFFWLHQDGSLWRDNRIYRSWKRVLQLVEEIDMQEYMLDHLEHQYSPGQIVELSRDVIEPAYQMMAFYLRHLCYDYAELPDGPDKEVKGLKEIFGAQSLYLPGKVLNSKGKFVGHRTENRSVENTQADESAIDYVDYEYDLFQLDNTDRALE